MRTGKKQRSLFCDAETPAGGQGRFRHSLLQGPTAFTGTPASVWDMGLGLGFRVVSGLGLKVEFGFNSLGSGLWVGALGFKLSGLWF